MPLKFAYLCDLFQKLEDLDHDARDTVVPHTERKKRYRKIIEGWFRSHRTLIDAGSTDRVALLSSLFPERRTDRVYWLQQTGLLNVLSRCLGLGGERLRRLRSWKKSSEIDLVSWVVPLVKPTDAGMPSRTLTVEDIDGVLDSVAAKCRFSSPEIRANSVYCSDRPAYLILEPLIRQMPSLELKWFLRIILKRLDPIVLEENFVLSQVHFLLPDLLRFQSTFSAANTALRHHLLRHVPSQPSLQDQEALIKSLPNCIFKPKIGVKVGRPNFLKARSLQHCIHLAQDSQWSVQKKYDGEYCQIHIDLSKSDKSIQIFAKSGKDATSDRLAVHDWIRNTLRLGTPQCKFTKQCILEGELVLYDDTRDAIAEFHKIRKHVTRSGCSIGTDKDSPVQDHEKLILIFYDLLLVDDDITLAYPYRIRKQKLTDLITYSDTESGKYSAIGPLDLAVINFGKISQHEASVRIQTLFAQAMARGEEGLVFKPYCSPYTLPVSSARPQSFIKLKIDAFPSLGDAVDLVVFGMKRDTTKPGSDKVKWNCFAIACLENKEAVSRFSDKPILRPMDIISRPSVSEVDMCDLSRAGTYSAMPVSEMQQHSIYSFVKDGERLEVDIFLHTLVVVEVFGSGFDKPSGKNYYMLRFPRIKKIHSEKNFEDVASFDELQEMAKTAARRPADLATEEDTWRQRLDEVNRLRQSPHSTRDTSSSGSSIALNASKAYSDQHKSIVRVDSCEFESDEHRSGDINATSSSAPNESLSEMSRSDPDTPLKSTPITPPFRDSHVRVLKRSRRSSDRSRSSPNYHNTKSGGPLSDVSNISLATKSPQSSRESPVTGPVELLRTEKVDINSMTLQTNIERDVKACRKLERVWIDYNNNSENVQGGSTTITHQTQEIVLQSHISQSPDQKAAFPLFQFSTVYISSHLEAKCHIIRDIPILSPANITTKLSHWIRELHDQDPTAPVVGESQAFPGLQKVVLVDWNSAQRSMATVERIKRLTLASDEAVRFWDYQIVLLLKCWPEAVRYDASAGQTCLIKALSNFYIGKVSWSHYREMNVWRAADAEEKEHHAEDLVKQIHWYAQGR